MTAATTLLTGASGTIGHRLVAALKAAGQRVRVLVLPGDPGAARLASLGCEVVEGDISQRSSLDGLCDGVDVVCHMAAIILTRDPTDYERINVDGTLSLLGLAQRAGVRHFVYISSASVLYPQATPYSRSKQRCERMVMAERSMAWTILRPTLVYDEAGGAELYHFWRHLLRFPVAVLVGDGQARKRPVWAEDLSRGIAASLGNERAFGKVYSLSGPESLTMEAMAELLLARSGVTRRIVKLPASACLAAARFAELLPLGSFLSSSALLGVLQDADLDPSAAMADLDYHPLSFTAGLEAARTQPPT